MAASDDKRRHEMVLTKLKTIWKSAVMTANPHI